MDRTERGTVALLGGYLVTLAVAYAFDEVVIWLVWAILMVALSGSAMMWYNR
ncbi:hypothetical protein [Natronolimnobius baerhuensis]|uniref:hypothetical protein n=1 Tax=Natronolimnobius baerhuensis TaxID=253108 RepID=UPI001595DAF8|nr:hypothetical protein [Natronolimnobius baerhuensis]